VGAAQYRAGLRPAVEETARRYAERLLRAEGLAGAAHTVELAAEHPAVAAARCGLMMLTGFADREAELCPAPIAACADGALAALAAISPAGVFAGLRGSQLLTERAAITGHLRSGAISPNGCCRLLRTSDGRIALNLPREDDWSLLEAWLETKVGSRWEGLAERVATRSVESLVERGRMLGLAVTDAAFVPSPGRGWREAPGEGSDVALSPRYAGPSPTRGRRIKSRWSSICPRSGPDHCARIAAALRRRRDQARKPSSARWRSQRIGRVLRSDECRQAQRRARLQNC
jgi:hypothetical protein